MEDLVLGAILWYMVSASYAVSYRVYRVNVNVLLERHLPSAIHARQPDYVNCGWNGVAA